MKPKTREPRIAPEAFEKADRAIEQLGLEAMEGSVEAAEELIDLGIKVAAILEGAYKCRPDQIESAATHATDFPIAYPWRKDLKKERLQMAKALPLARCQPFHTRGRLNDVYWRVFNEVWQPLERLRHSAIGREKGIQLDVLKEIKRLQSLTKANAKAWAKAFARYHVDCSGNARMDDGDFFYVLAKPERDVLIRQQRALKRRKKQPEEAAQAGKFGEKEQLKQDMKLWEIRRMKVTKNSFRNRLAEVVERRLLRMVRS